MLLSCWASWPFCKRVAASSAAVGAERTSVIKLPKTAIVKDSEYCIFLLVKKKSASSSGKMNGNSTRLKESKSGEKELVYLSFPKSTKFCVTLTDPWSFVVLANIAT